MFCFDAITYEHNHHQHWFGGINSDRSMSQRADRYDYSISAVQESQTDHKTDQHGQKRNIQVECF